MMMFEAPDQPPTAIDSYPQQHGKQHNDPQHCKRKLFHKAPLSSSHWKPFTASNMKQSSSSQQPSSRKRSNMGQHGLLSRLHLFQDSRHADASSNARSSTNNIHHNMALFDRSELVLGDLLGNGAFCQVHELKEVHLNTNKVRLYFSRSWWDNKLHQADRTREYIRQTCLRQQQQSGGCDQEDTSDVSEEDEATSSNHQKTPQPRYVVKLLKPNLATQRSYKVFLHAAADLRMEYEILSRLSHPNIVQLKGGAITEKHHTGPLSTAELATQEYFLLLERLEETLSQRIQCWKHLGSCSSLKSHSRNCDGMPRYYLEKLRIARDIASALSYAHQQRLIFRDLKPDNVALTADGTAKLIDFGLCRELPKVSKDDYSRSGKEPLFRMSGVGTRRYMAPEMILNRGYNQKVDCYSWAMVFYEMLCLEKPYNSYNREIHKILVCENEDRPRPTAEVPLVAHKLLEKAWTQDPGDRLSMAEIHDELEAMIDSAERQAMPPQERSLKVVMEMAELFGVEDSFLTGGGLTKREDSLISRKSTAELTVSTATSASSDMSILSSPWR